MSFQLVKNFVISVLLIGFGACKQSGMEEANSLFDSGNFEAAIEQYDTYLEQNPADADGFFNRGRAYEEMGDFEKAIADYEAAAEINPYEARFLIATGIANLKRENYNSAIINFNKALKKNPNSAEAYVYKGMALIRKGSVEGALESYNLALRFKNDYAPAYYNRGILYALSKRGDPCADLKKAQALGHPQAAGALSKYCK